MTLFEKELIELLNKYPLVNETNLSNEYVATIIFKRLLKELDVEYKIYKHALQFKGSSEELKQYLINQGIMKFMIKKYLWEIIPYTEEADSYCLFIINHPKHGKQLRLTNTSDCEEAIIISDPSQIDELIERLQKAKEFFNVR